VRHGPTSFPSGMLTKDRYRNSLIYESIALIGVPAPHECEEEGIPNAPQNGAEAGQMEMSGLSPP
jgi:hypothetical protein